MRDIFSRATALMVKPLPHRVLCEIVCQQDAKGYEGGAKFTKAEIKQRGSRRRIRLSNR